MPADLGEVNGATTPSPVWLNRKPPCDSIASRSTSSCSSSAARIAAASVSHRRVDPSISVNRNVTTPEGGPPSDTRTGCHKAHFNAVNRDDFRDSRKSSLSRHPEG